MRIVDGHNLIGAASSLGLRLSQPDKEERLLRTLATYRSRRRSREPLVVVFDGNHGVLASGSRRYSHAGIDVEWAVGEPADLVIERRVRSHARPREVEVVTSDVALLREVASWGARGSRSSEFVAQLRQVLAGEESPEKPGTPSADEVADWLDRFGGER